MTNPDRWAQIKAIFVEALDLRGGAREEYLQRSCCEDEELRAEVTSLLAAHEGADTFWERPAADLALDLPAPDLSAPAMPAVIGPYRIEREIGHGGMGAVYQARRDDDEYRKLVAIKVIKRGMDTDEIVRRFRHERQTLANLAHPNIATLLDGGTTEDGRPYFVMEYVDGQPIDDYCGARRLTIDERLRLFLTVCEAVQHAHRALVVHRDLKPDNILVTSDGLVKLVDFGIAKMLGPGPDGTTVPRTHQADRILTIEYSSPEQLRGEAVTTATDTFALGIVLYELLTGRHPFAGTPGVEQRICETSPELPSAAAADSRASRRLRGDLDTIVMKALRKEPARRYGSAAELAGDIQRHLAGRPVLAQRDTFRYRTTKFISRHRTGVGVAALVLLLTAGGVAAVLWQARIAVVAGEKARLEAAKAARISGFLQEMLRSADPANSGRDVSVASVLDDAAQRVGSELASEPEVLAAVRGAIGNTYAGLGNYEAAEVQLRASHDTLLRLHGPQHPDVVAAQTALAVVLESQGRLEDARTLLEAARAAQEAAGDRRSLERAETLNALAQVQHGLNDDTAAEANYREALEIRRGILGSRHADIAEILNNLAVIQQSRSDLAGAEQAYREALVIVRETKGNDYPGVGAGLTNLAGVLQSQGKLDEAESLYREAVALRRRLLGDEHPALAFTLFSYADLKYQKGDYTEAAAMSREVLSHRGKALAPDHPMVAGALLMLGRSLAAAGDPKQGEAQLREALAIRRRILPAGHWLIANTESVLGGCVAQQRRFAEAEPILLDSYKRLEADRGSANERTREARARLVALYEAWGRPADAAAWRK